MLDLARLLDLHWWLNRIEKKQRRTTLAFEELEDRVVPTLLGQQLFPADYPWNQNIANAPLASNSASVISHIGSTIGIHPDWGEDSASNGSDPLYGIPYNVVHGNTAAKIHVVIDNYPGESDIVDVPMPANVVIEGDNQNGPNNNGGGYGANQRGDSHLIIWDVDNNIAYELYGVTRPADPKLFPNTNGVELAHTDGKWHAAQESVWDMNANSFRSLGATSADAAGLSILAGLVRPDEGLPTSAGGQGAIDHAIRFTLPSGDVTNQYLYPASHQVSGSVASTKLPFGARLRLQNTPAVNAQIAQMGPEAQIIAHAMQQYGLVLADIGSAMYVTGTSAGMTASNGISQTWNMDDVLGLHALTAGMFDVVDLTPVVTSLSASSGAPGSTVTITGQNFSGSAGHLAVYFGTIQSSQVTYVSDTQLIAVVPAGAGSIHVTVQSGVVETDDISSNPSPNAKGAIFGYGTSTTTSADLFTLSGGGPQTVSGSSSGDTFANSSVLGGATDVLTIVVKDTTGAGVTGLASSAFTFGLAGGASAGTFGTATETATPGTYTVTFTGITVGTMSTLTVTVSGVTLAHHPGITVIAPAFAVIGPGGAIAAATGYDRPTFAWNSFTGADHYMLVVTDKTTGTTAFSVASTGGTSYVPTLAQALTPGHSYTTTVYAMSAVNAKLGTATQSFSFAALTAPTGLTPSGTIVATASYDRPTFGWNAAPGANHYSVQVMDGTTQVFLVTGIVGTSYTATTAQALTPGHRYTVNVFALSTNNKVGVKATQTFTLAALTAPTGLTPTGTITAATGYDRPTFGWNAVPGADHYTVQVIDSTTNLQAFLVKGIVGTSYTATTAQALTPGHKFTVNVYAVSTNNLVAVKATQTFTLAAYPATTLSGPVGAITTTTPTFAWASVAGADHYVVRVVDSATGAAVINIAVTGALSFTPTTPLIRGHRYTWQVSSVSTNGKYAPWSTSQIFTIS